MYPRGCRIGAVQGHGRNRVVGIVGMDHADAHTWRHPAGVCLLRLKRSHPAILLLKCRAGVESGGLQRERDVAVRLSRCQRTLSTIGRRARLWGSCPGSVARASLRIGGRVAAGASPDLARRTQLDESRDELFRDPVASRSVFSSPNGCKEGFTMNRRVVPAPMSCHGHHVDTVYVPW